MDNRGTRELRIDLGNLFHLHLVEGPQGVEISLQERLRGADVTVPLPYAVIEDLVEFLKGSKARFAKEGRDGRDGDQLDGAEGRVDQPSPERGDS